MTGLDRPTIFFSRPSSGVFLLVDAAHRFQLVDRRVFRIAGFGVEQTGLGAQAAMHAAVEIAGDGRVDEFLEDADTFFERSTHTGTPL